MNDARVPMRELWRLPIVHLFEDAKVAFGIRLIVTGNVERLIHARELRQGTTHRHVGHWLRSAERASQTSRAQARLTALLAVPPAWIHRAPLRGNNKRSKLAPLEEVVNHSSK